MAEPICALGSGANQGHVRVTSRKNFLEKLKDKIVILFDLFECHALRAPAQRSQNMAINSETCSFFLFCVFGTAALGTLRYRSHLLN